MTHVHFTPIIPEDTPTLWNLEMDHKFTAGFKLLDKFQYQWTQVHANSERNISKVQSVLSKIDQLDKALSERQDALDQLKASHKHLKNIQDQVDRLTNDVSLLEDNFEKIEDLLIVLKNESETCDTETYIDNLKIAYDVRAAELKEASSLRKDKLKSDHERRVDEFENEQQKEFDERRQVLEKAFEEEKTLYLKKTLM